MCSDGLMEKIQMKALSQSALKKSKAMFALFKNYINKIIIPMSCANADADDCGDDGNGMELVVIIFFYVYLSVYHQKFNLCFYFCYTFGSIRFNYICTRFFVDSFEFGFWSKHRRYDAMMAILFTDTNIYILYSILFMNAQRSGRDILFFVCVRAWHARTGAHVQLQRPLRAYTVEYI